MPPNSTIKKELRNVNSVINCAVETMSKKEKMNIYLDSDLSD